MLPPLQILLIGHLPAAADHVLQAVGEASGAITTRRIETQGQLQSALAQAAWDVGLCDEAHAGDALRIVRASQPEMPVIVLRGAQDEPGALELLRAGAADVLAQDQMARLEWAIQREVERARMRQAQSAPEAALGLWHQIFEAASWGIAISGGVDNAIQLANPAFARIYGYASEEINGLPALELFAPEHRDAAAARIVLAQSGEQQSWEANQRRKNGELFPAHIQLSLTKDDSGQVNHCILHVQDISERKEVERNLRLSEEKFSTAFRVSPDSININRLSDGMYLQINQGFQDLTGYTEQDVLGKSSLDINIWNDPRDRQRLVQGLRENRAVTNLEASFRCKDGRIKTCLMSARVIEINHELCILSITRDITERKQIENALRENELRYRLLFEKGQVGVVILNHETGQIIDFNDIVCQQLGYTREEFARLSVQDIDAVESPEEVQRHIHKIFTEGSDDFETLQRTKQGKVRAVRVTAQLIKTDGQPIYCCIWQDIDEQKRARELTQRHQEAVDHQNSLLNTLLDNLHVGVFMVEAPTGKPLVANRAAFELLGRGILPHANKNNLAEVYEARQASTGQRYPVEKMPVVLGMTGVSATVDDMLVVRPDQTQILLEVSGSPVRDREGNIWASLVSFQDITDRKEAEKQLNLQLDELRRWQNVTLGRERRILELKREVNQLLQKNGLALKYPSALEYNENSSDETAPE